MSRIIILLLLCCLFYESLGKSVANNKEKGSFIIVSYARSFLSALQNNFGEKLILKTEKCSEESRGINDKKHALTHLNHYVQHSTLIFLHKITLNCFQKYCSNHHTVTPTEESFTAHLCPGGVRWQTRKSVFQKKSNNSLHHISAEF